MIYTNYKHSLISGALFINCLFTIIFLCTNCTESPSLSAPSVIGVITGQVYNQSHPGPIPVGWSPPPLKQISTIRVLDINKNGLLEITSDINGSFQISLEPGTYYFSIKESPMQSITGPVLVHENDKITIQVFYNNGML
jgi:hypothetical protein